MLNDWRQLWDFYEINEELIQKKVNDKEMPSFFQT